MPLEIWILLALVIAGAFAAAFARLRRKRVAVKQPDDRNIYPLW